MIVSICLTPLPLVSHCQHFQPPPSVADIICERSLTCMSSRRQPHSVWYLQQEPYTPHTGWSGAPQHLHLASHSLRPSSTRSHPFLCHPISGKCIFKQYQGRVKKSITSFKTFLIWIKKVSLFKPLEDLSSLTSIWYGFISQYKNVLKCQPKVAYLHKNHAYGRHQLSRPMRIIGPIQIWRGCMIYL